MGFPKALLPLGGTTFIGCILRKLAEAGLDRPIVVLGRDAERIRPEIEVFHPYILTNSDPDRGQLSSIQIGISAAADCGGGCLLWPVDHPHVSAELVARLVRLFRSSGAPIAAPQYAGQKGHPTLFRRSLFRELHEAPLTAGAKTVVLRHLHEIALMEVDEPATVEDVDTPEEYTRLTGLSVPDREN
jgi:CTP:molybdopterin cytidylyltransferase MocA